MFEIGEWKEDTWGEFLFLFFFLFIYATDLLLLSLCDLDLQHLRENILDD